MRTFVILLPIVAVACLPVSAQSNFSDLAHTYSVVARDTVTGEMGVAVQTHWFAVGRRVPWAKPGVGVVATQSFTNPSFGQRGLNLLESGISAQQALDSLIASDDGRDLRQVAILSADGSVAAWTGDRCIKFAGHHVGIDFSVQANLMLTDAVWPAMARAFEQSDGPLAERLIRVLEAGQLAGGDIRGRQSAALVVVGPQPTDGPWAGRTVDLRVDDSETPIEDLRRLLLIHRAYEYMNDGDTALENNDVDGALAAYSKAAELYPDNPEIPYWLAVSLANYGLIEEALPLFEKVFKKDINWRTLTERLPQSELLNVVPEALDEILNALEAVTTD